MLLQAAIEERESELAELRDQASRWLSITGGVAKPRRGRPPGSGKKLANGAPRGVSTKPRAKAKRKSPEVSWDAVLKRLPRAFTMAELARATPALKDHQKARVIALARWSRAGAIKKQAAGKYRKARATS